MTVISWALSSERAVGKGHATLADVVNRPLRGLFTNSGFDPDGDTPAASGLWLRRTGQSMGVTAAHLSNPDYVLVGESHNAVVGLFSQKSGDHSSGIDMAEMDPVGTLKDKWFIGRRTSAPSGGQIGSSVIWEYGPNADYSLNPKIYEFSPFGNVHIGTPTNATRTKGIELDQTLTGGTVLTGLYVSPIGDVQGTAELAAISTEPTTLAAVYTVASVFGLHVKNMIKGAGSIVSAQYGIFFDNMTGAGAPFNYAIFTQAGLVRFGDRVTTVPSVVGGAKFNVPHGVAPSAPVDGDIWTTSAGLFVRINGVTVGPLT